jgi:hypothetical protein
MWLPMGLPPPDWLVPMKNLDPPILFVDFVRLRLFDELFLPNDCLDEGLDDKAHACWLSNRLDVPHVRMLFTKPTGMCFII